MRSFGFILGQNSTFSQPAMPGTRLVPGQRHARRLDDTIETIFDRACACNDLEAARDLLALLEKWHVRRARRHGRSRRISDAVLRAARQKLERRTAAHPR